MMFHNGCPDAETGYEAMKNEYPNVEFYKVNTLNSYDIRDQYANGGSKPYFKFYKRNELIDEVKYKSPWAKQEPSVRFALTRHNSGQQLIKGRVEELTNLDQFNRAMIDAKDNVVVVCYHNSCPDAEHSFDIMKSEYDNICFHKVNTLNS